MSRPAHPPPTITTSTDGKVFILGPHWGGPFALSPVVSWRVSVEMPHQNASPHRHSCSFAGRGSRSAASPPCRRSHHASDRRTCLRWCFAGGGKKTKSFES